MASPAFIYEVLPVHGCQVVHPVGGLSGLYGAQQLGVLQPG